MMELVRNTTNPHLFRVPGASDRPGWYGTVALKACQSFLGGKLRPILVLDFRSNRILGESCSTKNLEERRKPRHS